MHIDRTAHVPGHQRPAPSLPRTSEGASEPPPADVFRWSRRDLTPTGKIPIIVFSDGPQDLDRARTTLDNSSHGSYLSQDLALVNGFSALVDPKDMKHVLKALPQDVNVHINKKIHYPNPNMISTVTDEATPKAPPTPAEPPGVKGLDPARATLNIQKVWDRGFTGKGVGIAIIDSGIYPHPDLEDRIKGWVDIADGKAQPYDKFGHGTHVAGDAAGSGRVSEGRFKGIAPDADLIGVRITTVAEAIKGIQWCIENREQHNIKVINMSLGDLATRSYKDDPWVQAAEKAVAAGITVVVAAGNEGPDAGSISTPATDPRLITVGAIDDKRTPETGDDTMAPFSSRGPTSIDNLSKPDIVAPGVGVYSTSSPNSTLDVPELPHVGKSYIAISGTSMATPLVSGLVACLLQANPGLGHDDIKKILTSTANPYPTFEVNAQGAGLVNADRALDLALATPASAPVARPLPAPAPSPTNPARPAFTGHAPTMLASLDEDMPYAV